jgi:hypothetical protein
LNKNIQNILSMNLPSLKKTDLEVWFNKEEVMKQTALQLKKDLAPFGEEINLSCNLANGYRELLDPLVLLIGSLPASSLQTIFYRVDVKEDYAERAREAGDSYHQTIARLIIWREVQKVVTRILHSSGDLHL